MTTMRERIARAIAKFHWSVETPEFEVYFQQTKDVWFDHADAVIAEIREPTEAMVNVAWRYLHGNLRPDEYYKYMVDAMKEDT